MLTEFSNNVLDKILSLKLCVKKSFPESTIIISNIIDRLDNGEAALSAKRLNEHLCSLEVEIIDYSNIGKESLGKKGLHLNSRGSGKLTKSCIKKIKNLQINK